MNKGESALCLLLCPSVSLDKNKKKLQLRKSPPSKTTFVTRTSPKFSPGEEGNQCGLVVRRSAVEADRTWVRSALSDLFLPKLWFYGYCLVALPWTIKELPNVTYCTSRIILVVDRKHIWPSQSPPIPLFFCLFCFALQQFPCPISWRFWFPVSSSIQAIWQYQSNKIKSTRPCQRNLCRMLSHHKLTLLLWYTGRF